MINANTMNTAKHDSLVNKMAEISSSSLSDAMDQLGLPCGCLGIQAIIQARPFCGRAFTVHYVPCSVRNKGKVGDWIDDVNAGDVIVIDNAGRNNSAVWGDLMTIIAKQRSIEATVIDGACRDLPEIKQSGYPVYSKSHCTLTGKSRVEIDHIQQPVSLSGIQVRPGDIIRGDDTGVIVIPHEYAEEVLKEAQHIEAKEKRIVSLLRAGHSFRSALEQIN